MAGQVVKKVDAVKVVLDVPKPIIDFFESQVQLYGNEGDTVEKLILSALVDSVDAALNDLDCKCRNNVVKNLELEQVLKHQKTT